MIEIQILEDALLKVRHPIVLLAARYLVVEFNRHELPDWVAILANGNLEEYEAVISEALYDKDFGGGE